MPPSLFPGGWSWCGWEDGSGRRVFSTGDSVPPALCFRHRRLQSLSRHGGPCDRAWAPLVRWRGRLMRLHHPVPRHLGRAALNTKSGSAAKPDSEQIHPGLNMTEETGERGRGREERRPRRHWPNGVLLLCHCSNGYEWCRREWESKVGDCLSFF